MASKSHIVFRIGFLSEKNKSLEELVYKLTEKDNEIMQQNKYYQNKFLALQVK